MSAEVVPEVSNFRETVELEVIEDPAHFAALQHRWRELLSASTSDCLFLTWEWLVTWWRHLAERMKLYLVTVHANQQLVAIAPLVRTSSGIGPAGVPMLEFAGTGAVGSDYLDLIVRRGYEAVALATLGDFLSRLNVGLRLHQMKPEALGSALARRLAERGWGTVQISSGICPFIDLSGHSWESYLKSLGAQHRYNVRRRLRSLERAFDVSLDCVNSEPSRRDALAVLLDLHHLRWQRRGGSNGLHTRPLLAFHEEFSRLSRERGWLQLFVLRINGNPAAALYGFRYGRTFYYYQSGFDPAYSRYSVGLVTMALTIKRAIEDGADEYDLLHGNEAYKHLWARQARQLVRLDLYPPTIGGRLRRQAARLTTTAKCLAKQVLQDGEADVPAEWQ